MADPVTCSIDGLPANDNDYPGDDEFNVVDEAFRTATRRFWEAGARAENIEEALSGALTEAVE